VRCLLLSRHCSHTKHRGWHYAFFNNSFWSLNFYFVWLDPNWRPIAYEFLVKCEIERRWTKMKKMSNMGGVLEITWKIHCSFMLFFSPWLERGERWVSDFWRCERKSLFTPFLTTKIGFLGVHKFHEIRGTSWWLFRASMLHEKPDMSWESQN